MIEFVWFVIGVVMGVAGSIGYVMYLGHREIKKRGRRATNWQKIKKEVDKDIQDEYGV